MPTRIATLMDRDVERYKRENEVLREVLRETDQRLEEKIREFSLFRIVADTINRLMTKENSLRLFLSKVIEIIGAENASIMLIDQQSEELRLLAASGSKDVNPSQPRFPVGRGVAGWVAKESKPVVISDVQSNDRFADLQHNGKERIRALLCLPLVFENQTIGVLNVSSDRPDAFTMETERILYIIAGQVAIAITNTQTWEKQKETEKRLRQANAKLMATQADLRKANEKLGKVLKLEAIKQMATSMQHEINNPLTTIYSCSHLLESHISQEDAGGRESLEKIRESCKEINAIVYKMANVQDVVLTDYVGEHKMIDIDKSCLPNGSDQ